MSEQLDFNFSPSPQAEQQLELSSVGDLSDPEMFDGLVNHLLAQLPPMASMPEAMQGIMMPGSQMLASSMQVMQSSGENPTPPGSKTSTQQARSHTPAPLASEAPTQLARSENPELLVSEAPMQPASGHILAPSPNSQEKTPSSLPSGQSMPTLDGSSPGYYFLPEVTSVVAPDVSPARADETAGNGGTASETRVAELERLGSQGPSHSSGFFNSLPSMGDPNPRDFLPSEAELIRAFEQGVSSIPKSTAALDLMSLSGSGQSVSDGQEQKVRGQAPESSGLESDLQRLQGKTPTSQQSRQSEPLTQESETGYYLLPDVFSVLTSSSSVVPDITTGTPDLMSLPGSGQPVSDGQGQRGSGKAPESPGLESGLQRLQREMPTSQQSPPSEPLTQEGETDYYFLADVSSMLTPSSSEVPGSTLPEIDQTPTEKFVPETEKQGRHGQDRASGDLNSMEALEEQSATEFMPHLMGQLDFLAQSASHLPKSETDLHEFVTARPIAVPTPTGSTPDFYFLPKSKPLGASAEQEGAQMPIDGFDVEAVRRDFPILHQKVHGKPLIWMDNAATSQKPQIVIDTLSRFYERDNSNVHRGAHELAARATNAYEDAREKIQRFLGASLAQEIIFVRGTTEAINLVAQSYGRKRIGAGDEIVLTTLEHHSNIVPWQLLAQEKQAVLRVAPISDRGEILLSEYEKLLSQRTRIVALSHVSNVLGTVLPIKTMTEMAHRYGAVVVVDGAQSVPHFRTNVQELGADFYALSGHKLFGPTGIGALYGKASLLKEMPPWQGGGNMIDQVTFEKTTFNDIPAKFEAGTGNLAAAVGLGAAIDYLNQIGLEAATRHEEALMAYATEAMATIPGLRQIGTAAGKVSTLSFVLDNISPENIGKFLDHEGIAVRAGHHCAQPTMERFGVSGTVRPSLAFYNTFGEVDALIAAINKAKNQLS